MVPLKAPIGGEQVKSAFRTEAPRRISTQRRKTSSEHLCRQRLCRESASKMSALILLRQAGIPPLYSSVQVTSPAIDITRTMSARRSAREKSCDVAPFLFRSVKRTFLPRNCLHDGGNRIANNLSYAQKPCVAPRQRARLLKRLKFFNKAHNSATRSSGL